MPFLSNRLGAANAPLDWSFQIACILLLFYFLSILLEAPVRYTLSVLGLGDVLYLRDLAAIACIAISFFLFCDDRLRIVLLVSSYSLASIFILSVTLTSSIGSSLFGLKIFLPFLLGLAVVGLSIKSNRGSYWFAVLAFIVTCTGVIADFLFGPFSWLGSTFESSFGSGVVAREWWIEGGVRRLAGFTRASTSAAVIIALSGSYLLVVLSSPFHRLAVAVFGAVCIYLTTSKGLVVAFAIVSLICLVSTDSRIRVPITRIFFVAFCVLGIFVPIFAWIVSLEYSAINAAPSFLMSFADRLVFSWPQTFGRFEYWFQWFFGLGIGEVGIAKQIFSVVRIPPVDNIWLYLYATSGMVGLGIFLYVSFLVYRMRSPYALVIFIQLLVLVCYGMVANIFDDAISCFVLGLVVGCCSLASLGSGSRSTVGAFR